MATIAAPGNAQTVQARTTEMLAQPLNQALSTFAKQTGLQLIYVSDLAQGQDSKPIPAGLSPQEALTQLLAGTPLTFEFLNDRTVRIFEASAVRPASTTRLERPAATPRSDASQETVKRGFWDRFRVAQADPGTGSAASADAQGSSSQPSPLEEIVVTAQKREERLIETPQSVSVLSADMLTKLAATQFRDFANTVPGLNFQTGGAGFNQISLRGVTTGYDITPSVGNVVDDVPYGSSSAFARGAQLALDVGLFDVERIEVLRGPQGTLYGASTMGGLIKYVTKQPDVTRMGGEVQTGLSGTTDGGLNYIGAAALNLPLVTDKVALRASGFHSRDRGYVDNVGLDREDVNASRVSGGRLDLLALPTEALSLRVAAVLQDISRDGTATSDYTLEGESLYGGLKQLRLIPETFDQRFRLVSATATYDFGSAELTAVSSYQAIRSQFIVDDTPALQPILALCPPFCRSYSSVAIDNEVETDKFTQEIRLASGDSRPLQWLVGGFFTREVSENRQELLLLDAARQPAPNDLFHYRTPSRYKEYAAFGNLTYYFSDKLDLTGGMRYARNDQAYTQDASGLLIGAVPKRTDRENVSTYLLNARYRFTPNAIAYARFATGYRPGGPNAVSLDPVTGEPNAPESFKADTSKSYELGFKTQSATGEFGVDIAAYLIDWSDLQQLTTTASGVSYYANAASGAQIKGAELTLTARPVRGLTATGAFAFQDATMSDDEPILGARNGERLPNVPRFTAALSADYLFAVAALQPSVGFTFRSVSNRMASFDNNTTVAQYDLGSYSTFDARAGFVAGRADIQVYVRNVFDEHGQLVIPSGVSSLAGPIEVSILQPRTVGVTATFRF